MRHGLPNDKTIADRINDELINRLLDKLQLRNCVGDDFLREYLINAVLSYIEEREQDYVLGMRYMDWVKITGDEEGKIIDKIVDYLRRLVRTCHRDREDLIKAIEQKLDTARQSLENQNFVEYSICYLFLKGIYGDCISRYLLIKGVDVRDIDISLDPNNFDIGRVCGIVDRNLMGRCIEVLQGTIRRKDGGVYVRSRFIEIARDLYLLKQRFPDRSTFESPLLADRVFAYVHPRELPMGIYTSKELCGENNGVDLIKEVREFFRDYYRYLTNGGEPGNDIEEKFMKILCEFIEELNFRWYPFQVNGIRRALEKLRGVLKGSNDYLVIEAPTGSGKTEIMVITMLIVALARRLILTSRNLDSSSNGGNTPVAIIVYPRRALANDQMSRLIRYLKIINDKLKKQSIAPIRLSINYTEIRYKKEYDDIVREKNINIGVNNCNSERVKYGVELRLCKGKKGDLYVELPFITCPDNKSHPRFAVKNDEVDDHITYCGDEALDFIALTKEAVKERMGDIHVTIFETIRNNIVQPAYRKLFGLMRGDVYDHPLILVLDEVHTYVDIPGVRYALMIRRILGRIRVQCKRDWGNKGICPGVLVIGMSATIPQEKEFLGRLLNMELRNRDLNDYVVTVADDEKVPLGNEYFFIVVPSYKSGVDALTVSIQTIMDIFYNMPSLFGNGSNPQWRKKGIAFAEEFNVLTRLRYNLRNPEAGAIYRRYYGNEMGLQDLRNPMHELFRELTVNDYNDAQSLGNGIRLLDIPNLRSWRDGEVWWGYMLDTLVNHNQASNSRWRTTRFNKVIEYSSRRRESMADENIGIIDSTSTLEVGVDYSDVVFIYQHGAPPNIASLVQRAGRSGRRVHEHPLMRVAIGIQLSPEHPHQSWLFSVFTRSKSLRDALNYDMLYIPIESAEIAKQFIVEMALEYYNIFMKYSSKGRGNVADKFEAFTKVIPDMLMSRDFKDYVNTVFQDIGNMLNLDNVLNSLVSEVNSEISRILSKEGGSR